MEAKIIEKFTPELVIAICDCIHSVADSCLAKGLISGNTCSELLESTVTSEDKTRKLLKTVKNCTEIDSVSFDIFLRILNEKLPERSRAKLLTAMRTELTKEQALTTFANKCTTLVPTLNTGQRIMTSAECQLSVPHAHDVSRLLSQEQNPFIGKLEESIRQHERTVAEKKLLKEKLEENERLKAQLAKIGQNLLSLSSASETDLQDTTSSISVADIVQLKEKIEKLEQKSIDLGMAVRRYKSAIDLKGEEITHQLMIAQKKIELQYEQRFREYTAESFMSENREHHDSYSEEESDYDESVPKRAKIESGINMVTDDDSLPVTQLDRSLLRDIMMEYSISSEGTYMIETSWEQIGIQLEVADEELESIRKRRTSKGGLCDFTLAFRDTIRIWVKQETPPPTWSRFVEALERLKKFPKLADHLRSKYCSTLNTDQSNQNFMDTKDSSPVIQLEQPSLRDIIMELCTSSEKFDVERHWEEIGIQIGVKEQLLLYIRDKRKISCGEAFKTMIRSWLNQENPPPTWLSFVEALERLKICSKLASHLRSKYCHTSQEEPKNGDIANQVTSDSVDSRSESLNED